MPRPKNTIETFLSRVPPLVGDECQLWPGPDMGDGYGYFDMGGVRWRAHRLAYTIAYGEIPEGQQVNHTCDTPMCVRPDHLYAGTHQANMADMQERARASRWRAERTHCPQGHPYDDENTHYEHKEGRPAPARICRQCRRERSKAWREANRDRYLQGMREWHRRKKADHG